MNRSRFWLDSIIASPVILFQFVFRILPEKHARRLGRGLGRVAGWIGIRRKILNSNILKALQDLSAEERDRLIRQIPVHFGDFLGEWMSLPDQLTTLDDRVTLKGLEIVEECLARGKGLLICSAHIGNWELLATATARKASRPLTIVRQRLKNAWLDRWFTRIHRSLGFGDIIRSKSALEIFRKLKNNEIVGMLVDQNGRSAGIWLPFFNQPSSFHRGPGILANRTGCAVVTAFCIPGSHGWHIEFSEVVFDRTDGDLETDTEKVMTAYSKRLESVIREHPAWYFWYHRRWKTKVPEAVLQQWHQT